MYICENCLTTIKANTPSFLYTVRTRKKYYPPRSNVNTFKAIRNNSRILSTDGRKVMEKGKIKTTSDPGGEGIEIEKEIRVCPNCYEQLRKN